MEKQALLGILPPILSTLIFLLAWRPWKKDGCPNAAWASAIGLAIGYAISDILIRGVHREWHGILPNGGSLWHPHIAISTALIVAALTRFKKIPRLPVSILLTAAAVALYLRVPLTDNPKAALPALILFTGIGLLLWTCIWSAAKNTKGARLPLMLWAAAAGSALILLQSGNAALAQLSGALAASMGVFILLGWLRPQLPAVNGALPVYTLVMLGLLIVGRGFAHPWQKSDRPFIFAAAAVASPILTLLPPIRKLKPWAGTLLGVILTLAISAIGLYLTEDGFDFSGFK